MPEPFYSLMDQQQFNSIMAYQNEDVISRFTDQMDIAPTEAEDIFAETKKFLYLSQVPGIFIPDELLIVDEMWHNFVLFTRDYHDFCLDHFGRFVHHQPATLHEKQAYRTARLENPEASREAFDQKLGTMLSATYDHLGQDTVVKWFSTYPGQYSPENIKNLRRF
jgi:hypothetical protein